MSIKAFFKVVWTVFVLAYPLLVHGLLAHWRSAPAILLLLPPTLLNTWLATLFGRTLLHGHEPMISTFARIERAALSENRDAALPVDLQNYTRTLTKLWCALLVIMAVTATLLAGLGWYTWWAIFTGVISYVLIAMLFVGEYLFRRLHFSHYQHANPLQMIWFVIQSGPIWMRAK